MHTHFGPHTITPCTLSEPSGSRCVHACTTGPSAMINKNKRPYDPATLAPRPKLRRNIVDLAANNALPAARLAEVCRDVNAVDPASFADIARIRSSSR